MTDAPERLLRSSLRLGWAMSVFGAQSLARAFGGSGARQDVTSALDHLATTARRELGHGSRELLRSGQRLQADLAALWVGSGAGAANGSRTLEIGRDLRRNFVEGGAGGVRRMLEWTTPIGGPSFERSADMLFAAEQFAAEALEPFDTLEPQEDQATQEPQEDRTGRQLRERATRLLALDPYVGLWRLEGLGYAYGHTLDALPRLPFESNDLPMAAKMPILTGAALALARRFWGRSDSTDRDLIDSARRHAELCQHWAPAGTGWMLFEATGFVAHQLMPLRFGALAEAAAALGTSSRAAFHHGVGRALYLSLRGLFDARHPLARAAAMQDPTARRNAIAGVVWAATLSHLRHPDQLESLLDLRTSPLDRRALDRRTLDAGAIEHGLAGALTVWLNHLRGYAEKPLEQEVLATLRARPRLWSRLEGAYDIAHRRIEALERGDIHWDDVYLLHQEPAT